MNPWQDAEQHAKRAESYYQRGQWDRALTEIRSALSVRPHEPQWLWGLALTLEALERHEEAIEVFDTVVPYRDDDVELLWHLSVNLIAVERTQRALGILQRILKIDSEYEPAYCQMIAAYAQLGDHDQAEQAFYMARQIAEPCPVCYDHLAHSLAARGSEHDLERAVWCWKQTLMLDTHYPNARTMLGKVHWKQGKTQLAKYDFIRQLREDPHDIETLLMLSQLLIELGEFEESERRIRRAIDFEPACANCHLQLGELMYLQFKLDEAEEALRTAKRLNEDVAGIHLGLAQIAYRRGDFAEAEVNLANELERRDHSPRLLIELARLMLNLGKVHDAGKVVTNMLEGIEGQPYMETYRADGYLLRGRVFLALDDAKQARSDFRSSLRLSPSQTRAMHHLAEANMVLGRLKRAKLWLDRAEMLRPNDVKVVVLRRRLARAKLGETIQGVGRWFGGGLKRSA